jgi:hypothetical protein
MTTSYTTTGESEKMSEQQKKIEYVNFVVSLPKQVLEFLQAHKASLEYSSVEAYVNLGVLQMVQRDIEAGEFDNPTKELIESILKGGLIRLEEKEKRELRVISPLKNRLLKHV